MRKTLAEEFIVEGPGLHTGVHTHLRVMPSKEEKGIYFSYMEPDKTSLGYIPCHTANVVSTQRCTVLGNGQKSVHTVEHLMAALVANGITDAELRIDGPEVPALDGSALIFHEKIMGSGTELYEGDGQDVIKVDEPISFQCKNSGASYHITPSEDYILEVRLEYDTDLLDGMKAIWCFADDFSTNIARARTFSLYSEIESLLELGLIRGGNLENALVIVDRDVTGEFIKSQIQRYIPGVSDVSVTDCVINGPMYYDNEPARHKILDMLGDLSLLNLKIKGRISAIRPGHTGNFNLARHLINLFYG